MQRVSLVIVGEDCGACDSENDWHKVAAYAKSQLETKYPGQVDVAYLTMKDAMNNMKSAPAIHPTSKVPVVLIDGEVFSQGSKLDLPQITREIEARLH